MKDTEVTCFAHAKYQHPDGSIEWRPVLVNPMEEQPGVPRKFQAKSILTPKWSGADGGKANSAEDPEVPLDEQRDESQLLFAPRAPRIKGGLVHPEHKVFLDKAKDMRDSGGMTVQKIV